MDIYIDLIDFIRAGLGQKKSRKTAIANKNRSVGKKS